MTASHRCDAAFFDALEHILRAQLEHHQRLVQCIERKREAIRSANVVAIPVICSEEGGIVQKLAAMERNRVELVGRMTATFKRGAPKPMSMADLTELATAPQRTRLAALAAQLRDAVARVKHDSSIIRAAAEALSRHMTGIAQTVHSALSRARIYGNRGRIDLGAPLQSTLDLKS